MIAQLQPPTLRMGKAIVHLPPAAFLQATAAGEAVLARLVLDACAGAARRRSVRRHRPVCAAACRDRAVAARQRRWRVAALRAATATPGLKPVTVETRDLFRRPLGAQELRDFDAVVFDPPRQGALAQARELAASTVPLVVAVSCNPATFARDARS